MCSKFKYYLYGNQFHVYTDHNPLLYLTTSAKLDALGHRWLAELSIYNFSISYKSGLSNVVADSLSRQVPAEKQGDRHVSQEVFQELCKLLNSGEFSGMAECLGPPSSAVSQAVTINNRPKVDWGKEQGKDPSVSRVRDLVAEGIQLSEDERRKEPLEVRKLLSYSKKLIIQQGILYRKSCCGEDGTELLRVIVPEHLRGTVLSLSHDDMGHLGRDKTLSVAQERYFWPGLSKSVEDHIRNCRVCICAKSPHVPSYAPLVNIVTSRPFELVCMDFLSLEECKGRYKNILVITDHFTRYCWAFPTRDQEAKTVAKILYEEIVLKFGVMERCHSDQGGSFEAKVIHQLCKLLGVEKSRTTPYHPMGNGLCERFNRTLISMLRTLSDDQKSNWKDHLSSLVFSYNSTRHESTGYAPFYLMFGRTPKLPIDVYLGTAEPESVSKTVEIIKQKLDVAFRIAREAVKKSQAKQAKSYNRKVRGSTIEVGDFVLVQNVGLKGKHKLANKWSPHLHIVVSQPNPDIPVYRVRPENGSKDKVLHRNMMLPLSLPWVSEQNQLKDEVNLENDNSDDEEVEDIEVQIVRNAPVSSDREKEIDKEVDIADTHPDYDTQYRDSDANNSLNNVGIDDSDTINDNTADDFNDNTADNHDLSDINITNNITDCQSTDEIRAESGRTSTRVRRPPVSLQDYVCYQANVSLPEWQHKVALLTQILPLFPNQHSEICNAILTVVTCS